MSLFPGHTPEIRCDAAISDCGRYRWWLSRTWGDAPPLVFIGLNPSTADASQDDPTIRRCIGFARRERCGGLLMLNLFAFRATDPHLLYGVPDRVGGENNRYLRTLATGKVVAAWGAHALAPARAAEVRKLLSVPLLCLGTTKDGSPRHPLYVRADEPLRLWETE